MSKYKHILLLIIIFVICIATLIPALKVSHTFVHSDEPGWISSGYVHTEMLIHTLTNPAFDRTLWQKRDSYFHMNGQVGKWILGIPVWIYFHDTQNQKIIDHQNLNVDSFRILTSSLWSELKQKTDTIKTIVETARISSVVFAIITCFIIYGIGAFCYKPFVGFLSAILVLINPLFISSGTRAMTDIFYVCFLLGGLFAVAIFTQKKRHLALVALGVFSGLAASVKVTGILVGSFFVLIYLFFKERFRIFRYPAQGLLFLVSCLIVIYALNPFLWISPSFINLKKMMREKNVMLQQIGQKIKGADVTFQIQDYPQLEQFLKFPYIFLEWNYVMKEQQEMITNGTWRVNPQKFATTPEEQILNKGTAHKIKNILKMFTLLLFPAPLVGLFFLITGIVYSGYNYFIKHLNEQVFIPTLFLIANFLFIILSLKLNWDRYYLTTIISGQIVIAYGVYCVCDFAWRNVLAGRLLKKRKNLA